MNGDSGLAFWRVPFPGLGFTIRNDEKGARVSEVGHPNKRKLQTGGCLQCVSYLWRSFDDR